MKETRFKMTNTKKEYILYILVRNDLPSLNAGKAMAQAIHAAHLFTAKHGKTAAYKEWAGDLGFGTTVTLSADFDKICKLVDSAPTSGWVTDPTYPLIASADIMIMIDTEKLAEAPKYIDNGNSVVLYRSEKTCAYLFGEKEIISQWTHDLPTYQ